MRRSVLLPAAVAVLATAFTVSCSSPGSSTSAGPEEVRVSLITSTSGPLASYGEQYLRGFEAGLDHATDGTGTVDGVKVTLLKDDDGGDPAKGVSLAKQRIGQGVPIIAGSAASGVATQIAPVAAQNRTLFISGPAATDALTAANRYTFRSGRQTYQDVMTAQRILGDSRGRKVVVLAQDNAFGQANAAAVTSVLGTGGTTVTPVLAPPGATDLTPVASKVKAAAPDMVFVAWAGDTAQAMWSTLDQQGVLDAATVVTGLDSRASYPVFGKAREKVTLLAHYVPGAAGTAEAEAMRAYFGKKMWQEDLFTPDGFNAAQMVVEAVRAGGADGDTDAMVEALEGFTFSGVKGHNTVRAADHALLQPTFQAKFTTGGAPEVSRTFTADQVAPAEKRIG
ncbi:substrate-binding domain-containing protein [Streptomyces pilosus]|uniref:ABC transporter substrate-binding protein n=1 Tax=Streptomyces pilosus TaxID=28893 RepID=A0A918F1F9_9ACTN|nr:substrate-binding domain-containing protein [Streptomyces pilosus]GGQ92079.1 ABC transporter substrate-binding protein [Streptomyces pilosus]GGV44030.1 ABC transporter substrate-binding protein [Streptomyces pilosus]